MRGIFNNWFLNFLILMFKIFFIILIAYKNIFFLIHNFICSFCIQIRIRFTYNTYLIFLVILKNTWSWLYLYYKSLTLSIFKIQTLFWFLDFNFLFIAQSRRKSTFIVLIDPMIFSFCAVTLMNFFNISRRFVLFELFLNATS